MQNTMPKTIYLFFRNGIFKKQKQEVNTGSYADQLKSEHSPPLDHGAHVEDHFTTAEMALSATCQMGWAAR